MVVADDDTAGSDEEDKPDWINPELHSVVTWESSLWAEYVDVYMTWDSLDTWGYDDVLVRVIHGPEGSATSEDFFIDQTGDPADNLPTDLKIAGQPFQQIGSIPFSNETGKLVVKISDYNVPYDQEVAADAVIFVPRPDYVPGGGSTANDGDVEQYPGTWTNRDENGFFGGLAVHELDPRVQVQLRAYAGLTFPDPSDMDGYQLMLEWEGEDPEEDFIAVYDSADTALTSPATFTYSSTAFPSVWLAADSVNAGTSIMTLTLLDDAGEPLSVRPATDLLLIGSSNNDS